MKFTAVLFLLSIFSITASAEDIPVTNSAELSAAIGQAKPGDNLILAPGQYDIENNISCTTNGTKENPITVRSETLGSAVINFNALEGFKVSGAYWAFENLEIHGVCADDSRCEHAFHITGNADGTHIRNNLIEGFNAHIKGNGNGQTPRDYPDDVIIEYNEFYSASPRQTSNPVTPIDIVGGKRWVISHNYIHDFQKAAGNGVSYAAFLKGNSSDGIFSHNLVVCENLHQGGTRVGLSFGGGGTGTQFCEENSCETEHRNGLMANNIIANCSDVGIYINKGSNIKIQNNTLFNTAGIDIRFDTSSATLRNNLLDGRIRERNGGSATSSNNIEQGDLNNWFTDASNLDFSLKDGAAFVDKGETIETIVDDFCTTPREGTFDIGALEYGGTLCDTTSPFHRPEVEIPIGSDMGSSNNDTGNHSPDVGNQTNADMGTSTTPSNPNEVENSDGCSTQPLNNSNWTLILLLGCFVFRRKNRKLSN